MFRASEHGTVEADNELWPITSSTLEHGHTDEDHWPVFTSAASIHYSAWAQGDYRHVQIQE